MPSLTLFLWWFCYPLEPWTELDAFIYWKRHHITTKKEPVHIHKYLHLNIIFHAVEEKYKIWKGYNIVQIHLARLKILEGRICWLPKVRQYQQLWKEVCPTRCRNSVPLWESHYTWALLHSSMKAFQQKCLLLICSTLLREFPIRDVYCFCALLG